MIMLFILSVILLMMSGCVYDEEINTLEQEEKEVLSIECIGNEKDFASRSILSYLNLNIRNEISELCLTIDSIQLRNIYRSGTLYTISNNHYNYWEINKEKSSLNIEIEKTTLAFNDSLTINEIPLLPQTVKPWNPMENPTSNDGCYLLLTCQIHPMENKGNLEETPSKIAIPIELNLKNNQNPTLNFTLEPECPWYDISGTTPSSILRPIMFSATVEDWEEG